MKLVRQEKGSRNCGQCTVAMLTDTDLNTVISMYGHNSTSTFREAKVVLNELGKQVGSTIKIDNRKNTVFPNRAMIRISKHGKSVGHFIALDNDIIYCPYNGKFNSVGEYKEFLKTINWRLDKYFEVID